MNILFGIAEVCLLGAMGEYALASLKLCALVLLVNSAVREEPEKKELDND